MVKDIGDQLQYRIETAVAADQRAIKALIRAVQINPMGISWQRFLVARDVAGQLIGCGQVKPHRDGSWELASIAVDREWRGRGVARALIAQLMQHHPPPLWLTCISTLVPFYEQFGFCEVRDAATMPRYFRWIFRMSNLFIRLTRQTNYLSVMVHTPGSRT